MPVVRRRESAADVEDLDLVPASSGFLHDRGGDVQRLDEVLEIRALAADVEAQALDRQSHPERSHNQVHRLARIASELARQLHHRTGIGHAQAQDHSGARGVFLDLLQLVQVVVSHQRLVLVENQQRFLRLRRVGIDDLVPDEILLLLRRKVLDVVVHRHELGQRRHVEARAGAVERAHNLGRRVGFDGVVGLNVREVALEIRVVLPDDVVVDDDDRCPVLAGDGLEAFQRHSAVLIRVN